MKKLIFLQVLLVLFTFSAFAQEQTDRDKGMDLYRQGEYQKAVELLQNRVKAEEKDRLAWLYLGASYVKLKKNKEAGKAFNKTGSIYSENLPTYDKKIKITSKKQAPYTDAARNNRTSGNISVAVEFGADGKIGFVFPFKTLPDGLTESAVKATKEIKFEPAEKDGKPITVVMVVMYTFDITSR